MMKIFSSRAAAAYGLAGCVILLGTAPTLAIAADYNAVKGFSKKKNPAGPWSYLVTGTLLTTPLTAGDNPKVHFWWNGQQAPKSALIGRNFSKTIYTGRTNVIYPDHLYMDPQSLGDVAVRFTVPASGSYKFSGDFEGTDRDEASHGVEIDVNGQSVFTGTISGFGQVVTFDGSGPLNAGDTIDFLSLTSGHSANLSVGLKASISGH